MTLFTPAPWTAPWVLQLKRSLTMIANFGLLALSALGFWQDLHAQSHRPLAAEVLSASTVAQVQPSKVVPERASKAPVQLAFKDFFVMPYGPMGLSFTPKALALRGQRVSMVGYMVKTEEPLLGAFILSPRPVEINEQADGEANDLPANAVWVLLDPDQAKAWVPYRAGLLQIQGELALGREESSLAPVSWIRIQLERDAVHILDEPAKGSSPHAR